MYKCLNCDYNTDRKYNYNKHILSRLHINKIKTNTSHEFKCSLCNYVTIYKGNFKRHSEKCNNKHKNTQHNMVSAENDELCDKNLSNTINNFICSICNFQSEKRKNYNIHMNSKKHSHNATLLQQQPKMSDNANANANANIIVNKSGNIEEFKNEVITTLMTQLSSVLEEKNKSILAEQTKQMIETHTKLFQDMAINQTVTNNTIHNNQTNNHQFNMNMFLNETCKDAMNMSEFMENLTVTMEDMEMTGTLGFAKGMSRIIMNNLNALEVHKRPIHCSDAKRETMYVKNNGVWEKDTDDKKHTKELIYKVSSLNLKQLLKWRDLPRNKGYDNPEHKKNDEFTILVMEINKVKVEEIEKVVTIISKQVTIDKNKVRMSGYLN